MTVVVKSSVVDVGDKVLVTTSVVVDGVEVVVTVVTVVVCSSVVDVGDKVLVTASVVVDGGTVVGEVVIVVELGGDFVVDWGDDVQVQWHLGG